MFIDPVMNSADFTILSRLACRWHGSHDQLMSWQPIWQPMHGAFLDYSLSLAHKCVQDGASHARAEQSTDLDVA